jgi:hypothetical protein
MSLRLKAQTAYWLLTKHGDPWGRWRQHCAWKREMRHWGATQDWTTRIREAVAAPDNAFIPRHADAGKIVDGQLIMHNGLRVGELSYTGEGNRDLIVANRGVHEPQEERVFQEALKHMPKGATMLELGSFWAFYSMWFYQVVPEAVCYCVEPELHNLQMGQNNFALNFGPTPARVSFSRAYVGPVDGHAPNGVPIISVDGFVESNRLERLHMLHADTQGWEVDVLRGARKTIESRRVDYIFLSTHGNQLHYQCLRELRQRDFIILADLDYLESFSFDGLIVARRRELPGLEPMPLSLKG